MELKEIHRDERRVIHVVDGLLPDDKEFTIIDLNKGKAIGGCIHSVPEYFCVVEGTIWAKIGNNMELISEGQSGYIPAEYPHMFVGISKAKIIEWGVKADDKHRQDKDMRAEVNRTNGI